MMKLATPILLISIAAAVLAMPMHGSAALPENGCTSCLGGSLIPIDQDFDSNINASISLSVAVANGGLVILRTDAHIKHLASLHTHRFSTSAVRAVPLGTSTRLVGLEVPRQSTPRGQACLQAGQPEES